MLKRGSVSWTIWNIVEAILFLAGGILCLVNCRNPEFQGIFILVVAIFVILDAACRLAFDVVNAIKVGNTTIIKTSYGQALTGAVELALGIVLILISNSVKEGTADAQIIFKSIGLVLGIIGIVAGAVLLLYAIIFFVKKANSIINNVLLTVAAALTIALGVVVLVFFTNPDNILTLFFVVFGGGMALVGFGIGFLSIYYLVARARAKKAEAIETEKPAEEETKE